MSARKKSGKLENSLPLTGANRQQERNERLGANLAPRLNDRSLALADGSFALAPTTGQAKGKYAEKAATKNFLMRSPVVNLGLGSL